MDPVSTPNSAPTSRRSWVIRLLSPFARRVLAGMILVLPIVFSFFLAGLLVQFLRNRVLTPLLAWIYQIIGKIRKESKGALGDIPEWWDLYAAPAIALILTILALYFVGWLLRSRLHRGLDHLIRQIPIIKLFYQAFVDVFEALDSQGTEAKFKRVVLVAFPHPGMRVPALVTKTMKDVTTGERILAVCVLTGVVPPSGFTLMVPEADVTETNLTVNETMQAILSGGITLPKEIRYR